MVTLRSCGLFHRYPSTRHRMSIEWSHLPPFFPMGQEDGDLAFIRDGTVLAYYYSNIGLRTWEIADLTAEHQHSTNGHEIMMQGMMDGWVMGQDNEPLFWVPIEHRKDVYAPRCRVVIKAPQTSIILDLTNSRFGRKWTECIDKE